MALCFWRKDASNDSAAASTEKDKSPASTRKSSAIQSNVADATVSTVPQDPAATVGGPVKPSEKVTTIAFALSAIASIGGFMFGYESGQISGFLEMSDFKERFAQNGVFSPARQGTIVALLSAGTLVGCLGSAKICDKIGRKYTISASAFFYIVGVIIEITSSTDWVQFAMGRFVAGLGIGALSTSVPMYQSESVPAAIRGGAVASYQLAITLGIWTAYMINWGTKGTYDNSAQWRIPNGLSALWAILLGTSILFMPESPRWAYRQGNVAEARANMARLNGVGPNSDLVNREIAEIKKQRAEEDVGSSWTEIFTDSSIRYRTILGMVLQAGQQLTGANFFFYYGTTIFRSTGISDSYVTSIILGSVNVSATIFSLWMITIVGRRKSLMWGAAVMCACFLVYTFVGQFALDAANPQNSPDAGAVLITFTSIFIAAFATTWGPQVWTVTGELYPARYRATCIALATAANWGFNFLISFFTTFIVNDIHYYYGLVFAGSCFALFFIVYFFMIESKDRSLEEIDCMYRAKVNPRTSASWVMPSESDKGTRTTGTDALDLTSDSQGEAAVDDSSHTHHAETAV